MAEDKNFNPPPVMIDTSLPKIKTSRWKKLSEKWGEINKPITVTDKVPEISLEKPVDNKFNPPQPLDQKIADYLRGTKIGQTITSGIEKAGEYSEDILNKGPLLPELTPPPTYYPGYNPETGDLETPESIGVKTFLNEAVGRTYNKILRPLSTPKNLALAAGMAIAPEAVTPYLTTALSVPMVVESAKNIREAGKDKSLMGKIEKYSDAALNAGMATLIGAKGGAELINKFGEVPLIEALKEHVANSKLITDEQGFVHKDFLDTAIRIIKAQDEWAKASGKSGDVFAKDIIHVSNAGKQLEALNEARQISKELSGTKRPNVTIESSRPIKFSRLTNKEYDKIGLSPSEVRLNFKESSSFDPFNMNVISRPTMETLFHERGHVKSSIAKGDITPLEANSLVNNFIKDHFLDNPSKEMKNIGEALLKDFKDPELARVEPGSAGLEMTGQLRQELLANAYSWKRMVETYGKDKAMELFSPESIASYSLEDSPGGGWGQSSYAIRSDVRLQNKKDALKAIIATERNKLNKLKDQGENTTGLKKYISDLKVEYKSLEATSKTAPPRAAMIRDFISKPQTVRETAPIVESTRVDNTQLPKPIYEEGIPSIIDKIQEIRKTEEAAGRDATWQAGEKLYKEKYGIEDWADEEFPNFTEGTTTALSSPDLITSQRPTQDIPSATDWASRIAKKKAEEKLGPIFSETKQKMEALKKRIKEEKGKLPETLSAPSGRTNKLTPSHIAEGLSNEKLSEMGLRYNGFQEGFEDIPSAHMYTRTQYPQTTFSVMPGETLAEAHARALKPFLEYESAKK